MSINRSVCVFAKTPGLSGKIQREFLTKYKGVKIKVIDVPASDASLPTEDLTTLQQAEVLVADPGLVVQHNIAQKLHNLKWLQSTWAGVDNVMRSLDKTQGLPKYKLTRFGGAFGVHLAEYTLGYIISHERGICQMSVDQKQHNWSKAPRSEYRLLSQLSIGILGIGDIGKEIARVCKMMGMCVWGLVRRQISNNERSPHIDHYRQYDGISELLSSCDYICNVLPSTPQTIGLLGGDRLQHCQQKSPVLINIGRGDIIPEKELINALSQGWLSHAVLDVFENEPLPTSSPLWDHPKVSITPHVAGVSFDWQVYEVFMKNYAKYDKGEELDFLVDWDSGY